MSIVVLVFCALCIGMCAAQVTLVDSGGSTGVGTVALLNPATNLPLIIYAGDTGLRRAACADVACVTSSLRTLATANAPANPGAVYGADGFPIIVYSSSAGILALHCLDSVCGTTEGPSVVDTSTSGRNPVVTIVNGKPFIVWNDGASSALVCRTCSTAACATFAGAKSTLDNDVVIETGLFPAVRTGSDGNAVITYYRRFFIFVDFWLLHCTSNLCTGTNDKQQIASVGLNLLFQRTALVIGPNGFPHLLYRLASQAQFVRCTSLTCSTRDVSVSMGPSTTGIYGSIAIAIDGNPVAAYYDAANNRLLGIHCQAQDCSGTLDGPAVWDDPANDVGLYTSMISGVDGFPLVSYQDYSAGDLKVFHCTSSICPWGGVPPSATPTPSATTTRTRTPSVTSTPSPSMTTTPSGTTTGTPSPSSSATPSQTSSLSPSRSASPTAPPSFSPSPTRGVSATQTPSITASSSGTPSITPTASPTSTPTSTASLTTTPTNSASPSVTAPATASPTSLPTLTPTASSSSSLTAASTASPSESLSLTPQPSAGLSRSSTPSPSGSAQPSLAPSSTPTSTPTPPPSAGLSASSTAVPTPSPVSASPLSTPTPAPTGLPIPSTVTGTYNRVSTLIANQPVDIVTFDVTLDQSVRYASLLHRCPDLQPSRCADLSAAPPASPVDCPSSPVADMGNGISCSRQIVNGRCSLSSCTQLLAAADANSISVTFGQPYNATRNDLFVIRIVNGSSTSCLGFRIRLLSGVVGAPDNQLFPSFNLVAAGGATNMFQSVQGNVVDVCAGDPFYAHTDYVFRIDVRAPVLFLVEWLPQAPPPALPVQAPAPPPQCLSTAFTCLADGAPTLLPARSLLGPQTFYAPLSAGACPPVVSIVLTGVQSLSTYAQMLVRQGTQTELLSGRLGNRVTDETAQYGAWTNGGSAALTLDVFFDPSTSCTDRLLLITVTVSTLGPLQALATSFAASPSSPLSLRALDDPTLRAETANFGFLWNAATLRCPIDIDLGSGLLPADVVPVSSQLYYSGSTQGFGAIFPRQLPNALRPVLNGIGRTASLSASLYLSALDGIESGWGAPLTNVVSVALLQPSVWRGGSSLSEVFAANVPDFGACVMTLSNVFSGGGGGGGAPLELRVANFTAAASPPCAIPSLVAWSEQFEYLQANVSASDSSAVVATLRLDREGMLVAGSWQACVGLIANTLVESSLEPSPVLAIDQACNSPPVDGVPVCCTAAASGSANNSSALIQQVLVLGPVNKAALGAACTRDQCAELMVQDYLAANVDFSSCAAPLNDFGSFSVGERTAWVSCVNDVLGANVDDGVPCGSDSDCLAGTCSPLTGICRATATEADTAFLRCLNDRLSSKTRLALFELVQLPTDTTASLVELLPLLQRSQCVGHGNMHVGTLLERTAYLGSPVQPTPYGSSDGAQSPVIDDALRYGECSLFMRTRHRISLTTDAFDDVPLRTCTQGIWYGSPQVIDQQSCESGCTCTPSFGAAQPCVCGSPTGVSVCAAPADGVALPSIPLGQCSGGGGVCVGARTGTATPVASASACDSSSRGECTIDCHDVGCTERQLLSSVCLIPAITNPGSCEGSSTGNETFRWSLNMCVLETYNADGVACANAGGSFEQLDCPSLGAGNPATCNSAVSASGFLRCHLSRVARPCANQTECEAAGVCSDAELLARAAALAELPLRSAVCVGYKEPRSSGFGPCGLTNTAPDSVSSAWIFPGFTFGDGCAVITAELYEQQNDQLCAVLPASYFYELALDEATCVGNGVTQCLEQPDLSIRAESPLDPLGVGSEPFFSQRNNASCTALCGGTVVPAFTWTRGQWLPPTYEPVAVVQTAELSGVGVWAPRLDYTELAELLLESISAESLKAQQVFSQCSVPRRVEAVAGVAKLCSEDRSTAGNLIPTVENVPLVSFRVCVGESSVASAGGTTFAFNSTSLSGAGCVTLQALSTTIQSFESPPSSGRFAFLMTTTLLGRAYESVLHNSKSAGVVVGDAILLQPDPSSTAFQLSLLDSLSFEGCLLVDPNVTERVSRSLLKKYKESALGLVRNGELFVDILSVSAVDSVDADGVRRVCAPLTWPELKDRPVVPIQRKRSGPSAGVSVGAEVVFSLVGVAFLVGSVVLLVFQLLSDFVMKHRGAYVLRVMRLTFIVAFLVRAIYLWLGAGSVFTAESVANFVLSLIPTPLYFTAFSGTFSAWSSAAIRKLRKMLRKKRGAQKQKSEATVKRAKLLRKLRIYGLMIGINVINYAWFLALVIAASVVGVQTTTSCFGRVESSSSDVQRGLTITVVAGYAIAAVCMTVVLVILGQFIWGSPRVILRSAMGNVVLIGLGCVCQLVLHCTVMIVLTAVAPDTSPHVAFVLIFTELIPCLFVSSIGVIPYGRMFCCCGDSGSTSDEPKSSDTEIPARTSLNMSLRVNNNSSESSAL